MERKQGFESVKGILGKMQKKGGEPSSPNPTPITEAASVLVARAAVRRKWRENCGIPPKFQLETFDTFERVRQPEAFDVATKYAEEFPLEKATGFRSLILFSRPPGYGLGKTHLACAIAHRIIDRWCGDPESNVCPVRFITEPGLLLRIRATYNLRELERDLWHEREEEVYDELKGRKLLILDDVGKEQPADPRFVQRVYYHVVDGRYQYGLPMVLTSNLNMSQLEGHIGGAALDRLVEMTRGEKVELRGKSYRRAILE